MFEILMALATEELTVALLPAPFVDTLIIWLAMNRRAAQALQVRVHAIAHDNIYFDSILYVQYMTLIS